MSAVIDHETQQPIELVVSKTTTALAVVTKSIEEINAVEATVTAIEKEFKGIVYQVDTTDGLEQARKDRATVREPRYALQKMQKDAKAPLNELKRAIDDQAGALIERISAIEDPIHAQVAGAELRKEQERQAKAEAEEKRKAAIEERINDMREAVALVAGKSAADIAVAIGDIESVVVDQTFAEFQQRAETAKAATLVRLRGLHTAAVNTEAEQKRLQEVRERLDREKAEQDAAAEVERQHVAAETAAREIDNNRRSEIQGIQQQVVIAQIGRAGVRKGGTINCIRETLAETEEWVVTEENFGPLILEAQLAKSVAMGSIRALLVTAEKQAAEAKQLADEKAENDRVEQQRKAERLAEEKRLTDQRAALERQEEALRASQVPIQPATGGYVASLDPPYIVGERPSEQTSPPLPIVRQTNVRWRPKDEAVIHLVATTFNASAETAIGWILDMALRLARKSAEQREEASA